MKWQLWIMAWSLIGQLAHSVQAQKALILIHSRTANTLHAAERIKEGLEHTSALAVDIKRVAPSKNSIISPELESVPLASLEQLESYHTIIFGSPVYFHSPSAELLGFMQEGLELWKNQTLKDKQASFFLTSNGNGQSAAKQTLTALLQAFSMDVHTLATACPQDSSMLAYGECLGRFITQAKPLNPPIELPVPPEPVGLYQPYVMAGNLIYINQIALKNGAIEFPGTIGIDIDETQAKSSVKDAMLNVLSILHKAVDGDFSRVKQAVQISGYFNVISGYTKHSQLLNEASEFTHDVLGPLKGKHTHEHLLAHHRYRSIPLSKFKRFLNCIKRNNPAFNLIPSYGGNKMKDLSIRGHFPDILLFASISPAHQSCFHKILAPL